MKLYYINTMGRPKLKEQSLRFHVSLPKDFGDIVHKTAQIKKWTPAQAAAEFIKEGIKAKGLAPNDYDSRN